MHSTVSYRPEIDGLRAVAVLSVLLFHLDPDLAPGGFIGVDVFFVLSGFLITSIIIGKQLQGTFSLSDFYLRRIRRIAPVYFVVILATLMAGCLLMLPQDRLQLAQAALWSAFSLPNIHTWLHLDTGYFAADSRQIPLLHLWSLGVEEQFYLIWPLLLMGGIRWLGMKVLSALLVVLLLGSFALAQQQTLIDPAFAYYMLPTRAGELAIGGLLAFFPSVRQPVRSGNWLVEILAVLGLVLILGSLWLLNGESRFPGWLAVPACLGTALVIAADSKKRCLTLAPLRSRLMVGIGLISYSLYLWHWPVLALMRYLSIPLTGLNMVLSTALIFIMACGSYWLIERKTRQLGIPRGRQVVLLLLLPMLSVGFFSILIHHHDRGAALAGSNAGAETSEKSLLAQTAPAYEYSYNCQLSTYSAEVLQRPACVHGSPEGAPADVLLWGDSHAAHYIGVVATLAQANHFRVRNASLSTCPPVLGRDDYGTGIYQPHCTQFRQLMANNLAPYKTVILGANWSVHLRHPHFDQDFRHTVSRLVNDGKQVILLVQVPAFPAYDRQCVLRHADSAQDNCQRAASRTDSPTADKSLQYLQSLAAAQPGVSLLDIHDVICRQGTCSAYLDGKPVYFDSNHLSMEGSWQIGQQFLQSAPSLSTSLQRH